MSIPTPTHGALIWAGLKALKPALGRNPSDIEAHAFIDQYLKDNAPKLKRPRKSTDPKPRARDVIFDQLARLAGQNPQQITRKAGSMIAGAKKEILEVMPDATTQQVLDEIDVRWDGLRRKFPDTRNQTIMALVKYWAAVGVGGGLTRSSRMNVYIEPENWTPAAAALFSTEIAERMKERGWSDIGTDHRAAILQRMDKDRRASA